VLKAAQTRFPRFFQPVPLPRSLRWLPVQFRSFSNSALLAIVRQLQAQQPWVLTIYSVVEYNFLQYDPSLPETTMKKVQKLITLHVLDYFSSFSHLTINKTKVIF